MSRLLSLLVVIGGLAVCFSWFTESSRDRDLAVVTAIAPQGEATVTASPTVVAAGPAAPAPSTTAASTTQPKAAPRLSPAPVVAPKQDLASGPVTPLARTACSAVA